MKLNFRKLGFLGYAGGLLLGVGMVVSYGAIEVSSTPTFCGSCHVMRPYHESWETSTHSDIACVECHISPGISNELRKKYEAMSMVASYFTGTYGTNPWAEVDDAACLECHERRLLVGAELFGDILFNHGPHLAEMRRGKRLQCTSCHSQIVQGSHMAVTTSTCIICHFKDQQPDTGTARCTLCHQVPQGKVGSGALEVDHSEVVRYDMPCGSCHSSAGPDEGSVPRERCLTCHNDPERLAEYENGDLLHKNHVTDHKVECTHCHLEIQHVAPQHFASESGGCATCHGSGGHSAQMTLYSGRGGRGVTPRPDVMFKAGVRCEGCHFDHGDGETATAGEVSCMRCHGPGYRGLFLTWSQMLEERETGLRRQIDSTDRQLGRNQSAVFEDAEVNLRLVERAGGIHNVTHSLQLLDAAHRQMNEARNEKGLGSLSTPWATMPFESPCLECHAGVEMAVGKAFGKTFSHRPHVVGRGLECESCHSTHEERDTGDVPALKLNANSCAACHHGGAKPTTCARCHGEIEQKTYATENGEFDHAFHVGDMELECSGCHGDGPGFRVPADRAACSDCH